MDKIMYEDFQNICRMCMLDCDTNFNKDSAILDMFHKLTDIHFDTNDELPQKICIKCFDFINEIHSFSTTCKRTHFALIECLNNYKNKRIIQELGTIEETTDEEKEIKEEITIVEHKIEFVVVKDELDNDWDTNNSLNEDINEITISPNIKIENSESSQNVIYLRNKKKTHEGVAHSAEHPFQSKEIFAQSSNLKVRKRANGGVRSFKCDQCEKSFKNPSNLNVHIRVHSGEQPYKCNQCEKTFNDSSNLKRHKCVHSEDFPYKYNQRKKIMKCDQCEKSFNKKAALIIHKRVHSGERPYKCDQCEKSFSDQGNLKRHKRLHTGERPYKCDKCERTFIQIGNLKIHKRVHSGDRPYACDECGKSFKQLSNLKNHKRVHIRDCPFRCDECGKSFNQLSRLSFHKRVHSSKHTYKM